MKATQDLPTSSMYILTLLTIFSEGEEGTLYLFYVSYNSIDTMKATKDLSTSSMYILTLLTIFYEGEEVTLYLFYVSNNSIDTMKATKDLSTEPRCKFWTDGNTIIMGIQKAKQEDEGAYRYTQPLVA